MAGHHTQLLAWREMTAGLHLGTRGAGILEIGEDQQVLRQEDLLTLVCLVRGLDHKVEEAEGHSFPLT